MVHSRRLRMDDETGMDVESIAALLSARQYGPEAVQKIMALLGSNSGTSGTWPPGKKVKVTIQEMDAENEPKGTRKAFEWKPESEYFHEVILKQAGIGDFEVFYQDEDGDQMQVNATKRDIEEFLANHSQHPSPKLQVEWRPPTTCEITRSKAQEAKNWLTGRGDATDQAVKDAQEKVEKQGGKITMSSGSERSLVDHKGYKKEEWHDVVKGLSIELGLSDDEREALLNAGRRAEGKAQHVRQKITGSNCTTIVTHFTAYHTVSHGDLIDVVYGKHVESMKVMGGATPLPSENCIQYNDTLFAAWPSGSPHTKTYQDVESYLTIEIPSGWKVVNSSQEGFESIRQRLIVPYGWHAAGLVTSGPDGQMQGWRTANYGPAGEQFHPAAYKVDESRFQIKNACLRLLIQAQPSADHELVNSWKRYVQLSAQREWSERLGMPHGGVIQV